jgi:hypothetical protein
LDLRPGQFDLLVAVALQDGASQQRLADSLGIHRNVMAGGPTSPRDGSNRRIVTSKLSLREADWELLPICVRRFASKSDCPPQVNIVGLVARRHNLRMAAHFTGSVRAEVLARRAIPDLWRRAARHYADVGALEERFRKRGHRIRAAIHFGDLRTEAVLAPVRTVVRSGRWR